jgi:hypothetical protein
MDVSTPSNSVTRRTLLLRLAALFALGSAATLVGCGSVESGAGAAPEVTVAESEARLTVTVLSRGGFRMWGSEVSAAPMLHVHDGYLYRPGPVAAIFPGPLLTPINRSVISAEDETGLRNQIDQLGLLGAAFDLGSPPVADVPDTEIRIVDGETVYVHTFKALEMVDPSSSSEFGGVTAEQSLKRTAIWNWLSDPLPGSTAAETPYVFDAYRFAAQAIDRSELANMSADPSIEPTQTPWPVSAPGLVAPTTPAEGACVEVTGDDAKSLARVLRVANQLTFFSFGDAVFRVAARGGLPGEASCNEPPRSVSP